MRKVGVLVSILWSCSSSAMSLAECTAKAIGSQDNAACHGAEAARLEREVRVAFRAAPARRVTLSSYAAHRAAKPER